MIEGLRHRLGLLVPGNHSGDASIVSTSFQSLGIRTFGLVIALATQAYLARLLGAAEFGRYAIALGWAMLLVIVVRRGLDDMALRVATHYLEDRATGLLTGLIRYAGRTMTSAVLALLAVACAIKLAAPALVYEYTWPMIFGVAGTVFSLALLGFYSALLLASGRVAASQSFEQVWRPLILLAILAVSHLLFGGPNSADVAMAITAASLIAAVLLAARAWHLALPPERTTKIVSDRAEWRSMSLAMVVFALAQEGLNQAGLLLLGLLGTNLDAAYFAAAWRFNGLLIFGLAAVGMVSGPLIASAYRRDDKKELAAIVRVGARFALALAVAGGIVLIVAGRLLLSLFSPEFTAAYPVLIVLLVGSLATAATGTVAYLLSLTGSHALAAKILFASLAVCVVMNLVLIPVHGVIGAAIAISVAQIFRSAVLLIFAHRLTGVWSWAFAKSST